MRAASGRGHKNVPSTPAPPVIGSNHRGSHTVVSPGSREQEILTKKSPVPERTHGKIEKEFILHSFVCFIEKESRLRLE